MQSHTLNIVIREALYLDRWQKRPPSVDNCAPRPHCGCSTTEQAHPQGSEHRQGRWVGRYRLDREQSEAGHSTLQWILYLYCEWMTVNTRYSNCCGNIGKTISDHTTPKESRFIIITQSHLVACQQLERLQFPSYHRTQYPNYRWCISPRDHRRDRQCCCW